MTELGKVRFVRTEPEHGGMTAYTVWTAGGRHHGRVEQFPARYGTYWRAWRHPPSGRIALVCPACRAPRRFTHRRDAGAAMLLPDGVQQPRDAALVLATAALRLLTACDHGEQQPGTCPDCESLPPLVLAALNALPLLCPNLMELGPVALREALAVVEAIGTVDGHLELSAELGAAAALP